MFDGGGATRYHARMPRSSLLVLLAGGLLTACSGGPGSDTPDPVEVTPAVEVLSPFAAEILWTTTATSGSPVVFRAAGGADESVEGAEGVVEHRVLLQGLAPSTSYTFEVGDGTTFTGSGSFQTPAALQGPFRVLFDNAHGEQAGNADWVIDDDWPQPSPASPSSESSWSGAYSAWGYDLWETGDYDVQTLPPSSTFTYGGTGALDLTNFDVVILPEPNNPLAASEITALQSFVAAGGGLFLIADHEGSDRDSDGWESYEILNQIAATDAAWGWEVQAQSFAEFPANDAVVADPREPILDGPFGLVESVGFYATNALRIVPTENPRMRPILWRPNQIGTNAGLLIAAGWYGEGRVVLIGDSAPANDGTANPGNSNIYDSWNATTEDNAAFFLNATAWLAGHSG